MFGIYVQSSSAPWADLFLVACVFALLGAAPLLPSAQARRTAIVGGVVALVALGVGIASAFPTAYCDWFFRALGYCK